MYYVIKVTERPGSSTVYAVQHPRHDRPGFTTRRWYDDKRAAEAFIANLGPKPAPAARVRDALALDDADRGRNAAAAPGYTPTLAGYAREVINAKLADRQTAYGATTHANDEGFIRAHLDRDPMGRKRLGAITEADARAWVDRHYAATSQNGKTFGTLAPTTAEKHIRWVRGLFRRAVEVDNLLTVNPLHWFRAAPRRDEAPVKDHPALTEDEVAAVLATLGQDVYACNDRALFRFMAESGLRIGEALALEWADVEVAGEGMVEVVVHRQYHRDGDRFGPVKTASSNRRVIVPAWVLDAVPGDRAPRAALFMRDRGYNAPLARACRRAGVRVISTHGLRHTHATIMRDRGMPPELLHKRLGHTNIATTLAYYVKPSRQAQSAFLTPAPAHLRAVS